MQKEGKRQGVRRSLIVADLKITHFLKKNGPPLNMRRHNFLKDNRVTIKNIKHVQEMYKKRMESQSKI